MINFEMEISRGLQQSTGMIFEGVVIEPQEVGVV
jgi:hypothetical protein